MKSCGKSVYYCSEENMAKKKHEFYFDTPSATRQLYDFLLPKISKDMSISIEEARNIVKYSSGVCFPVGATVDGMLVRLLEDGYITKIDNDKIYLVKFPLS